MITYPPEYLADSEVTSALDQSLRNLLSACFTDPCFLTQRFCHEMPAHRWLIRDERGEPVAHLAAHDKLVGSPASDIRILGIAEVCVHPDFRGRGLVRQLIEAAHEWGRAHAFPYAMLFGNPAVYASSGYVSITNPIHRFSGGKKGWETTPMDSAMICPLHRPPPWPEGEINLRGPLF